MVKQIYNTAIMDNNVTIISKFVHVLSFVDLIEQKIKELAKG